MSERDLDFFASNPLEMTDEDIKRLEAMANTGDDPDAAAAKEEQTEGTDKQAAEGATAGAKDKPKGEKQEQQQTEAGAKTEEGEPNQPQVIRSKDGKHEIPYGVLAQAREEARLAREQAAAMQQQLDTLTRQAQGKPVTESQREQAQEEVLSEEALAELEDTNPEMAKAFKALSAQVRQMQEMVGGVRQNQEAIAQREQIATRDTVQDAIDQNATLRYWQNKDPAMWAAAINMDAVLKADPRNKGLPMGDRFAKVVSAVEAAYGPTELPEEFKPRTAAKTTATEQPAAATTKKVVEEALKAADSKPTVKTLSDLPGGTAPTNEAEELAALGAVELGNKFLNMSQAEINKVLSRLG